MRGKVPYLSAVCASERITPAYAGKRRAGGGCYQHRQDHPRICGEKTSGSKVARLMMGSPPHMRGKALEDGTMNVLAGITPAYAGKSGMDSKARASYRDHPRICGERKGVLDDFDGVAVRITPACAGKRVLCSKSPARRWDHPRVCGEKNQTLWYEDVQKGSPPRMRGKVSVSRSVVTV